VHQNYNRSHLAIEFMTNYFANITTIDPLTVKLSLLPPNPLARYCSPLKPLNRIKNLPGFVPQHEQRHDRPALTIQVYFFFNQLNIARKSFPTDSIWCSASRRRIAVKPGLPDCFSRINSRANCPV
jgi:hypothetical protein